MANTLTQNRSGSQQLRENVSERLRVNVFSWKLWKACVCACVCIFQMCNWKIAVNVVSPSDHWPQCVRSIPNAVWREANPNPMLHQPNTEISICSYKTCPLVRSVLLSVWCYFPWKVSLGSVRTKRHHCQENKLCCGRMVPFHRVCWIYTLPEPFEQMAVNKRIVIIWNS